MFTRLTTQLFSVIGQQPVTDAHPQGAMVGEGFASLLQALQVNGNHPFSHPQKVELPAQLLQSIKTQLGEIPSDPSGGWIRLTLSEPLTMTGVQSDGTPSPSIVVKEVLLPVFVTPEHLTTLANNPAGKTKAEEQDGQLHLLIAPLEANAGTLLVLTPAEQSLSQVKGGETEPVPEGAHSTRNLYHAEAAWREAGKEQPLTENRSLSNLLHVSEPETIVGSGKQAIADVQSSVKIAKTQFLGGFFKVPLVPEVFTSTLPLLSNDNNGAMLTSAEQFSGEQRAAHSETLPSEQQASPGIHHKQMAAPFFPQHKLSIETENKIETLLQTGKGITNGSGVPLNELILSSKNQFSGNQVTSQLPASEPREANIHHPMNSNLNPGWGSSQKKLNHSPVQPKPDLPHHGTRSGLFSGAPMQSDDLHIVSTVNKSPQTVFASTTPETQNAANSSFKPYPEITSHGVESGGKQQVGVKNVSGNPNLNEPVLSPQKEIQQNTIPKGTSHDTQNHSAVQKVPDQGFVKKDILTDLNPPSGLTRKLTHAVPDTISIENGYEYPELRQLLTQVRRMLTNQQFTLVSGPSGEEVATPPKQPVTLVLIPKDVLPETSSSPAAVKSAEHVTPHPATHPLQLLDNTFHISETPSNPGYGADSTTNLHQNQTEVAKQVGKEVRDGFQNHTQNPKFTESSVLNLTATPSQKHVITNPKDQVAVTGSASEAPGDVILDEAVTPTGHSEYTTGDDNSENSAFTHSDSGKNFPGMVTGMNGHGNPGSGIAASGKMVSGHPIFQLSLSNPADLGAGVQRILRQYLQQTLNAQNNEVQQIFIRLHPQHLGLMRIHLKYEKDGLRGKIDVSNAETLTLLQGQLKQLTERLNLQGIEVQQFDISQQEQFASASHSFREWQGMGKKRNVFTGHDVESSGNGMSDSTPRLSDGHLNVFM